jgi:tRNA (cytidine/uridine-2'-O-)-methyltransferase
MSSWRTGTNRRNAVTYPPQLKLEVFAMRLALYQPDIPQNMGTILRMAACLDVAVEVIGPAGFDMSDRHLRRAGLDYLDQVRIVRHTAFADFERERRARGARLVLLTTSGAMPFTEFAFAPGDILLAGRESAGVPEHVHDAADARLVIPIKPGLRSLNVAVATALVLGEALRQTEAFAHLATDAPRSES